MSLVLRNVKGDELSYEEMDGNFVYLENLALVSGATGATGPQGEPGIQGIEGPQGATGPAGSVNDIYTDWVAIGRQIAEGPFSVTQSVYRELPFEGEGIARPAGSIFGTTASNGFGITLTRNGNGTDRAFKIMCAVDIQAGNNKVLGLRLRIFNRSNDFMPWSDFDILLSECRAATGVGTSFAKLFTEWIYIPTDQNEEVVAVVANITDNSSLTIDRIKMVVTDLGLAAATPII
jgi:hypothetical protein